MNGKNSIWLASLLVAGVSSGCDTPGMAFESAFPTVVCEQGGQRRVRVYGHGFDEGAQLTATLGGVPADVQRVDDYTLDVYLPDISLSAESYPWDPHDFNSGEYGMFADLGNGLEPVGWDVLVPRSQLTASGAPDFKDLDGNDILYRSISVEAIVYGYETVEDESGESHVEPMVIPGPFNFGYFSSDRPWVDAAGQPLGGCDDGTDRYVGEFCYEPLYYTEAGQPLLYDASEFAYWVLSVVTDDPFNYASWDPYIYKGAWYSSTDVEDYLLYYDGRSNETDYAPGDLFNQSFGVFFTLSPVYVYTDAAGNILRYDRPPSNLTGLSFVGMEASGVGNEFFPGVLPISHGVDLSFQVGGDSYRLGSPLGIVSKDFDYSLWYTSAPYYDFTEWKYVDLDSDGTDDDVIPVDGSWGCVWLAN